MKPERSSPEKGIRYGEGRYKKNNEEGAEGIQKNMKLHIQSCYRILR